MTSTQIKALLQRCQQEQEEEQERQEIRAELRKAGLL